MNSLRLSHIVLIVVFCCAASADAAKPLLELKIGERVYVGRSVRRNDATCWLQAPDGRLTQLRLAEVSAFRKVAPQFQPWSVAETRDRLARELGRAFEVAAAGQYVVAAPPGRARAYAALLDNVHREFTTFFSRRNFGLGQPEFPLIAIVFPNQEEFGAYCHADGMPFTPGLRGYYNPESNRIALFEDSRPSAVAPPTVREELLIDRAPVPGPVLIAGRGVATVEADFRDTLVHEATHQLAFNMGLHARIGENPRWVVEGLAMIFERSTGNADRYGSERQRINEERYEWFMRRGREQLVPLKQFIADDRPFRTATLDAYSQAWALTFYLSERRSADFAAYLKRMRDRNLLKEYTPDERVADFQASFGDDLDWLQVEWLRFMDGL